MSHGGHSVNAVTCNQAAENDGQCGSHVGVIGLLCGNHNGGDGLRGHGEGPGVGQTSGGGCNRDAAGLLGGHHAGTAVDGGNVRVAAAPGHRSGSAGGAQVEGVTVDHAVPLAGDGQDGLAAVNDLEGGGRIQLIVGPLVLDGDGGSTNIDVVAVGRIVLTSRDYIPVVIGHSDSGLVFAAVILEAVLGQGDLRVVHDVLADGRVDCDGVAVLILGIAQYLGKNCVGAYLGTGRNFGGIRYSILRIDNDPLQRCARKLFNKLLGLSGIDQVRPALRRHGKCRLALCNVKCRCVFELIVAARTLDRDLCSAWIDIVAVSDSVGVFI